ncbi:sensor histidine kinase [Reichenbachiella ulvae]|uniref:histidine kinase n=1 Tax=Reichenbachiella ulvae TaxID=2980104 RepID=A0ABT3CZM2_9BACT|nr:PAS domain-containing sensor histidine kinase [Reichenbachiella ulvae]MCV9389026.1 ATP-binding protein [Reichenbachiella ulvae]
MKSYKAGKIQLFLPLPAIFGGLMGLMGWYFSIPIFTSLIPDGPTMKFNTALVFIILGSYLSLNQFFDSKRLLKVLLIFTLAFSLITILEYLNIFEISIDNFFIYDRHSSIYPGRMSPATAFSFLVLSTAALFYKSENQLVAGSIHVMLLMILGIALLSLITYILNIPAQNKVFFLSTMAFPTSVILILLNASILLQRPDFGFTSLMTSQYQGSKFIRLFMPFLLVFPIILSYCLIAMINNDSLNLDFGIILYTVVFIFISLSYTGVIALAFNTADEERKKLLVELESSNINLSQFKDAMDHVSLVTISDPKDIILYANKNFVKTSGYTLEELLGSTHDLLKSGHHNEMFYKKMWDRLKGGNVWSGDIKYKAKNGTPYWIHTAIIPFQDENQHIYQYLSLGTDITERKKAEELLSSQYVKKLEQKNVELEQLTSIASHDLQQPMQTIINYIDLMQLEFGAELPSEAKEYLDTIKAASRRNKMMIQQLLDYSKIGKKEKPTMVNCKALLEQLEQDLQYSIQETEAEIELDELPTIEAYESGIRSIFQNLISNAIKFQKKANKPKIHISAERKEDGWCFSVEDNGIGIDPKFSSRIFNIFYRLHSEDQFKGTGIGLAHCQKIVGLHGGRIWVDSGKKEGSKFKFIIPNHILHKIDTLNDMVK